MKYLLDAGIDTDPTSGLGLGRQNRRPLRPRWALHPRRWQKLTVLRPCQPALPGCGVAWRSHLLFIPEFARVSGRRWLPWKKRLAWPLLVPDERCHTDVPSRKRGAPVERRAPTVPLCATAPTGRPRHWSLARPTARFPRSSAGHRRRWWSPACCRSTGRLPETRMVRCSASPTSCIRRDVAACRLVRVVGHQRAAGRTKIARRLISGQRSASECASFSATPPTLAAVLSACRRCCCRGQASSRWSAATQRGGYCGGGGRRPDASPSQSSTSYPL